MKKILTLTLLITIHCSLFTIHGLAQNQQKVDSLLSALKKNEAAKKELGSKAPAKYDTAAIKILYGLSAEYWGNNPDKAMEYGAKIITVFQEMKDTGNYIGAILDCSQYYLSIGNYSKAIEFIQKGMSKSKEMNYQQGIALSFLWRHVSRSRGEFAGLGKLSKEHFHFKGNKGYSRFIQFTGCIGRLLLQDSQGRKGIGILP